MKTDENYAIEIIVWVGGSVVYEDTAISTDKGIFLASRERKAGSDWVDVTDLTELRVWEYNLLVEKLNIHYPEYPIEHLEGRFV